MGESTGQGSQQEGTGERTLGRDFRPDQEPDCLPAATGVGVSARMNNDSNSYEDRAKEGRGSERRHAGTGEVISACIHVANSHGDRAKKGRTSDRRQSAISLWERVESCVTLLIGVVVGVSRDRGVESSIIGCKTIQVKSAECQWV